MAISRSRRAIMVVGALVVVAVGLHLVNLLRPGPNELFSRAEPIVDKIAATSTLARPEYQELALARLPENPLNGPFIRLDERIDEAAKVEKPATEADEAHSVLYAFEFDGDGDGDASVLKPVQGSIKTEVRDGILSVSNDLSDMLVSSGPIGIARDDIGQIVMRVRADRGLFIRFGWVGERAPPQQRAEPFHNSLDVRFDNTSEYHNYIINARDVMQRGLRPDEKLAELFVQVSDADGAKVDIDYIRFLSKVSRYVGTDNGRDHEAFGGERRQVMYMRPDQTLRYEIDVPLDDPTFTFGTAVLLQRRSVRFEVFVDSDGVTSPLHDQLVSDPEAWRDSKVDLSPWAGRKIGLNLRVSGDPSTIGFWSSPLISSTPNKPFNVIFMIEDTQRADYLSLYGNPRKTTPFKDELFSQQGIVFNRAISQAEKTRPSVASYLTGLYPTAHGLWYFSDLLSERFLTLPEIMRAQGYVTASWTQNGNAGTYAGLGQGFDRLFEGAAVPSGTAAVFDSEPVYSWIEENKNRNFFLYLHAIDPHADYDPPSPYREKYVALFPNDGTPVERNANVFDPEWLENPTIETRRLLYEGEIEHNDSVVRRFIERLRKSGMLENTLIVMMSDHGEWFGERGLLGNRLWDHRPPGRMEITHVPLMMLYPPLLTAPKRVDTPVQLIDVAPTVLDLAGIDRAELLLQGDSLVDLFSGETPERFKDRVIVSEEPTAMLKDDPCSCGSLHSQDWQVNASSWVWPRRWTSMPELLAFTGTVVYAIEDNVRASLSLSYLPDLLVRWRLSSVLSKIRETNMEIWRKMTDGESGEGVIDPDTLDRLKGLGYIN